MKKLLCVLLLGACAFAQTNYSRILSGVKRVTASSYTFLRSDSTKVTVFNGTTAVTLPSGFSAGFSAGNQFTAYNGGAVSMTITCSSCTINGVSTFSLAPSSSVDLYSDGQNYVALAGGGGGSGNFVAKTGDTMTGLLVLSGAPISDLQAATKKYVDDTTANGFLAKSGGTLTGPLIMSRDPVQALEAATKEYVDQQLVTPNANASQFLGKNLTEGAPTESGEGYVYDVNTDSFVLRKISIPAGQPNALVVLDDAGGAPTAAAYASIAAMSDTVIGLTVGNTGFGKTGELSLCEATTGCSYIIPHTVSSGTNFQLPSTGGTIAAGATSPIALDSTTGRVSCPTCVTTAGATLLGPLAMPGDPVSDLQVATKHYVDQQVVAGNANATQIQGRAVTATAPSADYQGLGWNVSASEYRLVTIPQWPLTTTSANPAQSGIIRLGPTDAISARDTASAVDVTLISKGAAVTGGARSKCGGVWGCEAASMTVSGNLDVSGNGTIPAPPTGDSSTRIPNTAWVSANTLGQVQLNGVNQTRAGTLNFAGSYFSISYLAGVLTITPNLGAGGFAAYSDSRITGAEQAANKNATNGYAGLTSGLVAAAQLGSGTPSSSTYLRGDRTWAAVAAGGHVIYSGGTLETQRAGLNFVGATVADNSGSDRTDVTMPTFNSRAPVAGNYAPASGDYSVAQITGAAADSNVVHNTGAESPAGAKDWQDEQTFEVPPVFNNQTFGYTSDAPASAMTGCASGKSKIGFDSDGIIKVCEAGGSAVNELAKTTGTKTAGKQLTFDSSGRVIASAYDAAAAGITPAGNSGDLQSNNGSGGLGAVTQATFIAAAKLDTTATLGTDDTKVASQKATKTYVDNAVAGVSASGCTQGTPASATATGSQGACQYDNDYYYVAIATNLWRRTAWDTGWFPGVATPSYSPDGGTDLANDASVTISDGTSGAAISYCLDTTGGCTPTTSYSTAVTVTASGATNYLRSHATKAGYDNSPTKSATYTYKVATPTSSPGAGPYSGTQSVTISSTTTSAYICYTTNGDTPAGTSSSCSTGTHYTAAFDVAATATVKAIGYKANYTASAEMSDTYTISGGGGSATYNQQQKFGVTTSNSTDTITMTNTISAGHLAVIVYRNSSTPFTNIITSVTDSGGNTWYVDANSGSTGMGIAYSQLTSTLTATSSSITLHWTNTNFNYKFGAILDFTATLASTTADAPANAAMTYGTTVSAPITTTNAADLIIAALGSETDIAYTNGAGGFTLVDYQSYGQPSRFYYSYRVVSSTGTYNPGGTWATNNTGSYAILGLKLQ